MKLKYRSWLCAFLLFALVATQLPRTLAQTNEASPYAALTKGQVVHGFRTDAVYLDATDKPFGGHFIHLRTGFTLDLLQIQSVPQAVIYANTFTVSDMGEPHTQEHLLIGKGNKGRNINVLQNMSLTQSNASTNQTFTSYQFKTAGGAESFYAVFNGYMTVLLYPDYTEEEVRREVRNWGVTENPDKSLRLEEKGSVYNEMTSSMNNPDWRLYDNSMRLIYGPAHALSFNAGGAPDAIRKMTPDDIKRYHDANYHLGNMGAPNMSGEVIMNSARLTEYSDTSRDAILNFLASKLYTGGGAHSVFNKTIGAGLAYSNGIGGNPVTGLMSYYAERTPELPQTLRFAIGEVKRPMSDPLAEYVIALTFSSRASSPYEARGEAMASNMADGITPEVVSRFRRAILETRKMPDLSAQLYQRKDRVHERVFPGYGMKAKDIEGRNFFVIGA